jgi:hypothetical protein
MRGLANNMVNNLMSALCIHAPSLVMMELGNHVANGFLQGILQTNVAGPAAAHLSGVVGAVNSSLSSALIRNVPQVGRGAAATAGATSSTFNLQLDGQTIASFVMDDLTKHLQMNGAIRKSQGAR